MLEALIGVALAAVLSGLGTMRLVTLVHAVRLAGAAHTVATALRLVRGRALAAGEAGDVRFDARNGRLELRAGPTLETRSLPQGVAFAGLPARAGITFSALGTAENGTITLVAGAGTRRVIVNQRGRVRVQ